MGQNIFGLVIRAGVIFGSLTCFWGCQEESKNNSHTQVSDASIRSGRKLAEKYCRSCHLLPEPGQLDARSWEDGVLPQMGPRLGIYGFGFKAYPSFRNDPYVPKGFYPQKSAISLEQWQHIIDYYSALAPDTLISSIPEVPIESGLNQFSKVDIPLEREGPRVSFVKIDPGFAPYTVLAYEQLGKQLYRIDVSHKQVDSISLAANIVDLSSQTDTLVALNIGVMTPNNGKFGTVLTLPLSNAGMKPGKPKLLLSGLRRPVRMIRNDFNRDGREDLLVCEYGHLEGSLSWFERGADTGMVRHLIRESAGAIQADVRDLNGDGAPDIVAQFAQGDESIYAFINDGSGNFTARLWLRFPPSYGSSSFELADFNGDGALDVLYTCGDNADYSVVLKPYHGIYIYLNDGKDNFRQAYFFHMNGCFKAMARDFDKDGDLDIAAIAFFADYKNRPEEGFVYLQQDGALAFKAFSHPDAQKGRWLTMDAGDMDGDGWMDIILGNFSAPAMDQTGAPAFHGPALLLLRNKALQANIKPAVHP